MVIRFDQSHGRTTLLTPWSCHSNAKAVSSEIVAFGLSIHERVTRCERTFLADEYGMPIHEQLVFPRRLLQTFPGPSDEIETLLADQGVRVKRRIYRIHTVAAAIDRVQSSGTQNGSVILQIEERLIDEPGRVFPLRHMSCCEGTVTVAID